MKINQTRKCYNTKGSPGASKSVQKVTIFELSTTGKPNWPLVFVDIKLFVQKDNDDDVNDICQQTIIKLNEKWPKLDKSRISLTSSIFDN